MTSVDYILISRFYQIAKISVLEYEAILPKLSNPDLQTLVSKQMANYNVISEKCSAISKTHKIALSSGEFFKRCKQLIDDNLTKFTHLDLQFLVACTTALSLHTLVELYNVESATSETINIGKHLQLMQEQFLQLLREIKLD